MAKDHIKRTGWAVIRTKIAVAAFCLASAVGAKDVSKEVYVVSQDGNSVNIVNVETNEVTSRIAVGDKPVYIAISRNGGLAYVTHPDGGKISKLDLQAKRVQATYDFPGEPFAAVL